jgi:hypothetical protein
MALLKIFVGLVMLIAVVVGILALTLPRDAIVQIIQFRDFFDVALPILAFGALIKYLCSFHCGRCCKKD